MRARLLVILSVLLCLVIAPWTVAGTSASAPEPRSGGQGAAVSSGPSSTAPERVLPRTVGGRRAVEVAGDRLPDLAALNGRDVGELRALLLEDETLVLTPTGRLAYRDLLAERSDPESAQRRARFPTSQTFALHSRPGSQRTILIDVDGASGHGSQWATSTGSVDGFSLDGDPAFNAEEHAVIQDVWLRVAEDYAPFDVDVTTEDPGQAALTRSGSGDQVYGTRAQVTNDVQAHADLCGSRYCTGIAYVGVFDEPNQHASLQPAWAFTAHFKDAASIAETVSHEVGHNLGLDHHGRGEDPYYAGHAHWAPIMGSGLKPVIQWSAGSYSGATNSGQDDLALITDTDPRTHAGGLRLVPDEAGGTVAEAAPALPASGAVISSRSDVDVFDLGTCTTSAIVAASPAPLSPNLDVRLRLLDASSVVLDTADPRSTLGDRHTAGGMGATATAPAGRIFVEVDGVGTGDPSTGYDDYGSLGRYTLSVSGCDARAEPTPTASATSSPTTSTTTSPTPTVSPTPTAGPTAGPTPTVSPTLTVSSTPSVSPNPTTGPTASPTPPLTRPDAPVLTKASPGPRGGKRTAKLWWSLPGSDGGSALTGFAVLAHQVGRHSLVARTLRSGDLSPDRTRGQFRLPRGRWSFQVIAVNAVGDSPASEVSRTIRPR